MNNDIRERKLRFHIWKINLIITHTAQTTQSIHV